jgi:tRNA threonylcarbamoyladenosine biosynthesis protein TsaE
MSAVFELSEAAATEELGARLARCLPAGAVVHLFGNLGAGKTTLVRGFLHALGHVGIVKSPTYTLVEPYETPTGPVYHFDLYRLLDPEELEFMGIRDFFTPQSRCLVEWPEKGDGYLPAADVNVNLEIWNGGRRAVIAGQTSTGAAVMGCLAGLI